MLGVKVSKANSFEMAKLCFAENMLNINGDWLILSKNFDEHMKITLRSII